LGLSVNRAFCRSGTIGKVPEPDDLGLETGAKGSAYIESMADCCRLLKSPFSRPPVAAAPA
jgi:hypothetical protein